MISSLAFIICFCFPLALESTYIGNWGSLVFAIPNQFTELGRICANQSSHYCLSCYRTLYSNEKVIENDEFPEYDSDVPPKGLIQEFENKILALWNRINFFSTISFVNCCKDQANKYVVYGYLNSKMSPDAYLEKLTDYKDEEMRINYIGVHYDPSRCWYVITELGFGAPPVIYYPELTDNRGLDKPYVFPPQPGREPSILTFPHLRARLSFGWFKRNIMCKDQPWICQ
ncbi:uncharacterized protein LOC142354302 [Convolutriloba macropyga]|uniref:uncharacterized protein LOC142354302 n=1 Tax=Convolutriloba macropyga TaxID=536237 RepID=UPI003F51B4C5